MITFEQAKFYTDLGWSVIPVMLTLENGKIQKKPAIAWREYQQRFPTDEELHRWFDTPRYNGIGLITGRISGVVVVDVDAIDKEGFDSPMTARTISGGWHVYYKWEEEIRNDAGIDDKPLDFRGDGGFVVLPPSSLGEQTYSWVKQDLDDLPVLPQGIKSLLKIRKHQATKEPVKLENNTLTGLPRATEGNRNNTASQVAGIICANVSKRLLPLVGYSLFQNWNQTLCTPPLDEGELQSVWSSIYQAETAKAQEANYTIFSGQEAVAEQMRIQEEYGQGLTTGFTSLDRYFKFLPQQLYLISAPTHTGKTLLALNMASRIAAYGERVLFCSLEQGVFISPLVTAILGTDYPDSLSLLTSNKMLTIDGLTEAISSMEDKPRLIIVDHLHFIQKKGKGTTEDIDEMIIALQNMAKQLHLPVLVVAHVRKINGDRPAELDDLRDSSSLSQVPSVVMLLYRPKASTDTMQTQNTYLDRNGIVFIAKNRIQGKTGYINFSLKETGEFVFI